MRSPPYRWASGAKRAVPFVRTALLLDAETKPCNLRLVASQTSLLMPRPSIELIDLRDCASRVIPNIVVSSIEISPALIAEAPTPAQSVLARYPGWSIIVYA